MANNFLKMNSKNKSALFTIVLILMFKISVNGQQQTLGYTQYMDNLTPLNPAYSLLDKAGSISTLARKSLVGIDGAPTSYQINGNIPIESIGAATGLFVVDDQVAIEHQIEVNAFFAKSIQLGENNYLGVSLNAGFKNYVANYSSLDSTDPTFQNDVRQTKPNVGFGVIYYSDWYYLGLSVPEFTVTSLGTGSVQSNSNFKNHYYFAGALITNLDDDIKFKPATLFSYVNGLRLVADVSGTIYLKDIVGLGVNYRTNNAAAGIITINVNAFHIGYSYQFNTGSNNLDQFSTSTHEVTLSYRFGSGAAHPKLL